MHKGKYARRERGRKVTAIHARTGRKVKVYLLKRKRRR